MAKIVDKVVAPGVAIGAQLQRPPLAQILAEFGQRAALGVQLADALDEGGELGADGRLLNFAVLDQLAELLLDAVLAVVQLRHALARHRVGRRGCVRKKQNCVSVAEN